MTARPCLPSAHSRKPLGKEVWELSLFGETPLFPAPLCQEALAKNWAKKSPSASSLRWGKLPPHSPHLHVDGHPVVTSTFTGGFGTRPWGASSYSRPGQVPGQALAPPPQDKLPWLQIPNLTSQPQTLPASPAKALESFILPQVLLGLTMETAVPELHHPDPYSD